MSLLAQIAGVLLMYHLCCELKMSIGVVVEMILLTVKISVSRQLPLT